MQFSVRSHGMMGALKSGSSVGVWEYGSWDAPNTLGEGEVLSTSISSPAPITFRVTNKFPDAILHCVSQQPAKPLQKCLLDVNRS